MKRVMLFAALLAWSAMASAVVYKWTDAQGKLQYGDRPPDGVHAEVVEGLGAGNRAAAPAPRAASSASTASASTTPNATNPPAKESAKDAVAQDVAATRDKQCADAQANYKSLIEGRRLYKTGPNGERQYLTSDQIDAERVNAKQALDEICNSPT